VAAGGDRFAGGDQAYLRDEQYRDSSRLQQRANIHVRYGTAAVPWFEWVGARFDLRPGLRVLEVGCGPGWLWEGLAASVPPEVDLVLTDLSPGMVAEARERVGATGALASVDTRVADLGSLPFEDASFDRAIANHMLYHLPDPAAGVAELARVVRPDGRVVCATNGPGQMQPLWSLRAEVFGSGPVEPTVEAFGRETGAPILERCFGDVRWESYHDELHCTDVEDLVAYVCSSPPGEDATPEQLVALRAALSAALADGDGVLRVSKDTGCFVAERPRTP
jgi:ubiquinone/menaquinone biosynthesis C-methylase UbiE